MKTLLVHLSDAHLEEHSSSSASRLYERVEPMAAAIAQVARSAASAVLVFSGDLSQAGQPSEFEGVHRIVTELYRQLQRHRIQVVHGVVVPGNHDCDFSGDQALRELALDRDHSKGIPDSILEALLSPQEAFQSFAGNLSNESTPITRPEGLFGKARITTPDTVFEFFLINTAAFSRLPEAQGGLKVPVSLLSSEWPEDPSHEAIAIAVMHHPYNWVASDDARALRAFLTGRADIILTGHDHEASNWGRTSAGGAEQVFVEGGELWNHTSGGSRFGVIEIAEDQSAAQIHNFEWKEESRAFEEAGDERLEFHRRDPRVHSLATDQPKALEFLEDPGASLEHPRTASLKLADIFTYPDFQVGSHADSRAPIISGSAITSYCLERSAVLIIGDEKTGKTALGKSLCRKFELEGRAPVLFCEGFSPIPQGKNRVRKIDDVVGRFYSKGAERFWRVPIDDRVAIVDDFDRGQGTRQDRVEFVKELRERFGTVVVIASSAERLEEIAMLSAGRVSFEDFERLYILEFGHKKRADLIRRWIELGQDVALDRDVLFERVLERERVISELLGRHLFPSIPLYVLILLQQLEAGVSSSATITSTYGHLYETLLKRNLTAIAGIGPDLDARINYLSHFAFWLYKNRRNAAPESMLEEWHKEYCRRFASTYAVDRAVRDLTQIKMWEVVEDLIGFRYRYAYQFFVAKYMADHIDEEAVRLDIHGAFSTLADRDSGNIIMFLGHLSKSPHIVRELLDVSSKVFADVHEFDLGQRPCILKGDVNAPRAILRMTETSPDENRDRLRIALDEADRELAVDQKESTTVNIRVREPEIEEVTLFLRDMNSSFRMVQMCGQVLRNYYGTIEADPQANLAECAYSLGLKFTASVLAFLDRHYGVIVKELGDLVSRKHKTADPIKVAEYVNKELFGICQFIAFAGVRHVARSLALDRLKPTFDRIVGEKRENLSYRLIDIAIRLEHSEKYPLSEVMGFVRDNSRNPVASELLRRLVWLDLVLRYRSRETAQAVCRAVDIQVPEAAYLSSGRKLERRKV